MANMDGWSLVLLAAAGFLAVNALMHMMKSRYESLLGRFRQQWQEEQEHRAEEERKRRREERRRRLADQIQKQLDESSDRAA